MTTHAAHDNADATVATRMAERICAFRDTDITPKAMAEARTAIIDTVACTLSGLPEPLARP